MMLSTCSAPGQSSSFNLSNFRKELPILEEIWPKAEDQNVLMFSGWREFIGVSTTDCLLESGDSLSPKEQFFLGYFWVFPVVAQHAVQFSFLFHGL